MSLSKQELKRQYRERKQEGCVYCITHTRSGKRLILSTQESEKAQNLFAFAVSTGPCIHPLIAEDWEADGAGGFQVEILEALERTPTQTDQEFAEDIKALEELWRGNFAPGRLYT